MECTLNVLAAATAASPYREQNDTNPPSLPIQSALTTDPSVPTASRFQTSSSNFRVTSMRAGLYESLIKQRIDHVDSSYTPVCRLPPRVIGGLSDVVEKSRQCNCRRSSCLKLYCECFSCGIYCSIYCTCVPCKNNGTCANRL